MIFTNKKIRLLVTVEWFVWDVHNWIVFIIKSVEVWKVFWWVEEIPFNEVIGGASQTESTKGGRLDLIVAVGERKWASSTIHYSIVNKSQS